MTENVPCAVLACLRKSATLMTNLLVSATTASAKTMCGSTVIDCFHYIHGGGHGNKLRSTAASGSRRGGVSYCQLGGEVEQQA